MPDSAANELADTDKSIPNTGEFSKRLFCLVGFGCCCLFLFFVVVCCFFFGGWLHVRNFVTEFKHTNARQMILSSINSSSFCPSKIPPPSADQLDQMFQLRYAVK